MFSEPMIHSEVLVRRSFAPNGMIRDRIADDHAAGLWPGDTAHCISLAARCCLALSLLSSGGIAAQSGPYHGGVMIISDDQLVSKTKTSSSELETPTVEPAKTLVEHSGVRVRWNKRERRWTPVPAAERATGQREEDATTYLFVQDWTKGWPQPPDRISRQIHTSEPIPTAQSHNGKFSQASSLQHQTRTLVHWSKSERRWKPVSRAELRAAHQAAQEVTTYLLALPAQQAHGQTDFGPQTTPTSSAPATNLARNTVSPKSPMRSLLHQAPEPSQAASGRMQQMQRLPAESEHDYSEPHGVRSGSATIDAVINQAAERHGVDPNLVRAIIKAESNFNCRAVSRKGAMGLMQLTPQTAKNLKVKHPFDPAENVDAGVRRLKSLLASYNGDVPLSLAAYNAGEAAVARANGVPNFNETRNYVRQITSMYWNSSPEMSAPPSSISSKPPSRVSASISLSDRPIRVRRASNGVLMISDQ